MKEKNKEGKPRYIYLGRKFFQTILGEILLFTGLIIAEKMEMDVELYKWFVRGIVGLVIGFGATNAGISIGSFFKNNKGK